MRSLRGIVEAAWYAVDDLFSLLLMSLSMPVRAFSLRLA